MVFLKFDHNIKNEFLFIFDLYNHSGHFITFFASCKISQLNSVLMGWVGVGIGQGLVGLASG